jgi:hypothetical protein
MEFFKTLYRLFYGYKKDKKYIKVGERFVLDLDFDAYYKDPFSDNMLKFEVEIIDIKNNFVKYTNYYWKQTESKRIDLFLKIYIPKHRLIRRIENGN